MCPHFTCGDSQGLAPGLRVGNASELRLCERWTSSAKHVFLLDAKGSVAKSTDAGIPWLKRLRDEAGERIHFWPFDGWAPASGKSVVAEVYPSIFRNRYAREDRSADEQDAYAAAHWMADMDGRQRRPGKLLRADADRSGARDGRARGVDLGGWRNGAAQRPTKACIFATKWLIFRHVQAINRKEA